MNRHDDNEFVERLRKEARDYNAPPKAPRETMWARIQEARAAAREDTVRVSIAPWWRRPLVVAAAAAAVVIIAFAVGRFSAPEPGGDGLPVAGGTQQPDEAQRTRARYRMAMAPVLDQAELLFTQFRASDALNGDRESYAARASALLVDTRYLMNTPVMDDPELGRLLSDLELVLAQIVRLAADGDDDREWVQDSMEERLMLPRIRTASRTDAGSSI